MLVRADAGEFQDALVRALPKLEMSARRLTRSRADAGDLVQATCLRALEKRHRFVSEGSAGVTPWLLRILHNLHLDRVRRARFERPEPSLEHVAAPSSEPPPAWTTVDERELAAAVRLLTPPLREAYTLYAVERLSYAAIAARTGVKIATVGTRICRARAWLRKALLPAAA